MASRSTRASVRACLEIDDAVYSNPGYCFARIVEILFQCVSRYFNIFRCIGTKFEKSADHVSDVKKILVVDDEPDIREIVAIMLEESGYDVATTGTGDGVVETVQNDRIDLVVLDLGLPGIDGLTLTRAPKEHADVGVIIISGRGESTEKIIGLEIGADDYLGKPFEPRELLARVRSVLERLDKPAAEPAAAGSGAFQFEDWTLDVVVRSLIDPDGNLVNLSSGEFGLLRAFVESPNQVLSRDQLLDQTHGMDTPAFDRSVDVQIARLRKKLEPSAQAPKFIKTVRNAGYIFAVKVSAG